MANALAPVWPKEEANLSYSYPTAIPTAAAALFNRLRAPVWPKERGPTATLQLSPQRLPLSSHRRHAPVYGKWRGFRRSTSSECWRSSRARSSRQCRACGSASPPSAPSPPASLAPRGTIAGDSSASASAPATSASSPLIEHRHDRYGWPSAPVLAPARDHGGLQWPRGEGLRGVKDAEQADHCRGAHLITAARRAAQDGQGHHAAAPPKNAGARQLADTDW
eukprot:scaffold78243_cov60-Phaeocystis_antarctica.AAC.2